jgi:hypothetical protein
LLCAALDAFCESLDAAEILPYMPQLISELLQVLQMGRPGVQEMALSAVSSIAAAAEQAFQPYTGRDAGACYDDAHFCFGWAAVTSDAGYPCMCIAMVTHWL